MRIFELADRLRALGLTVIEVAGWHGRGHDFPVRPDGALRHWTAGPLRGDSPTLAVCVNGRTGLAGPLCNVYQSRRVDDAGRDIVYVVAAGKANHAGKGSWNGASGNYAFLGLEIEWAGPAERFHDVRRRKYTSELVMRALLDCAAGTNTDDVCEHREYAPHRKIDTNLDGAELRRRMAELAKAGADAAATSNDLELTMGQYEEINKKLDAIRADIWHTKAELHAVAAAVHGTGDDNRDDSIFFNTKYLRGELLGGDNAARLRQILRRFGDPDVVAALAKADAKADADGE